MSAFCQLPLLCSTKWKSDWKKETGLYGLGFPIDLLLCHVSIVIPACTWPLYPRIHQPMSNKLTFAFFHAARLLPGWKSPPSQQSSSLLLCKSFPRKGAIPTKQLLMNALVLFLLNAAFPGSLCVIGSPAQVRDWGFTLVPHSCTTLARFFYENYCWAVRRCVNEEV